MGFMKSDVISALDAANSDLAIATEYLLGVNNNNNNKFWK